MATTPTDDVVRDVFVTGLKNAHALEHQALALIDRQLDRLQNYDEIAARLREHRVETERQIERVDTLLGTFGESASGLKDVALSVTGNMAAIAHVFAPDEILKNSFASFAFENFEAASYKSLIVVAQEGGFSGSVAPLQQTLDEELAMAAFLDEKLPYVTRKFLTLSAAGETAGH